MAAENLIPLGQATPRGARTHTPTGGTSKATKRKHKNKHTVRESGKENAEGSQGDGSQTSSIEAELAPLKLTKSTSGKRSTSPGKSPSGKTQLKVGMFGSSMLGAQNKTLLDNLPKVERKGFDVEAKIFQQVQKEYEAALSKKQNMFDIKDRAKHNAVIPLLANATVRPKPEKLPPALETASDMKVDETIKLGMTSKMVLPAIPAEDKCSSQDGAEAAMVRTVEEVYSMLPEDFRELKQMMELHRDLKSQMARNKEQMAKLQESADNSEMMDLLRQQSSHVVMMMKDVLDRMESYPEELWALYGAVEAYEKCNENMEALRSGDAIRNTLSEESVGPQTMEEHEEALVDIYSHILEGVHRFLAVEKTHVQHKICRKCKSRVKDERSWQQEVAIVHV